MIILNFINLHMIKKHEGAIDMIRKEITRRRILIDDIIARKTNMREEAYGRIKALVIDINKIQEAIHIL